MALRRLGQPQVVADMVAGFLIGPMVFGAVLPAVQSWLFPVRLPLQVAGETVQITHPSLVVLHVLGQLGLVLYMFVVGLSFDTTLLRKHVRSALASAVTGVLTPIVTGGVLGWLLVVRGGFFGVHVEAWQGALFVGAAMAVTAFPVLARMVHENGLGKSPVGTVALACAAADDTVAWILLALVVSTTQQDPSFVLVALGGTVLYVSVVLTAGRRLFAKISRWTMDGDEPRSAGFILVIVLLLLGAAFTDAIGIHAVVGAFLCGLVMPRDRFNVVLRQRIEPVAVRVLVPLFFVYAGLNTKMNVLLEPLVLGVLAITLVVAIGSKGIACTAAARMTGLGWSASVSLGALMNARGLMELVLLSIGLEKGIITPALYTVLALMTVITTLAAMPLYQQIRRRWPEPGLQEVVHAR